MADFETVINTRYKAPILSKIWSSNYKIQTMRQLWIDLAIFQQKLGINYISDKAIQELISNRDIINYDRIQYFENKLKHDIVSHIHAFSELCPEGAKIIHLGATSNFINDNVDSIIIKESFSVIKNKYTILIDIFKHFSKKYSDIPTIAYTHLQSAQLITIGRRFSMWLQDLLMDYDALINLNIPFRGIKGTVGTEDTLLKLFNNDTDKCDQLNINLSQKYGFKNRIIVCGQTYSRKYDVKYINLLSSLCQTLYKIMNDLRLLSGKGEVYEYFSEKQVGSSAMPYKKNPITCEKICSLCRYVINQEQSITQTYINQWLERSLDDSAIKRILFPECFMLVEYILDESFDIINNLQFNFELIKNKIQNHMINIISEEIIIKGVEKGYNRQELHEILRSILTNSPNLSFDMLVSNTIINSIISENNISFNPLDYIGRSIEQSLVI